MTLETHSGVVEPAAKKVRPIMILGTLMATPVKQQNFSVLFSIRMCYEFKLTNCRQHPNNHIGIGTNAHNAHNKG